MLLGVVTSTVPKRQLPAAAPPGYSRDWQPDPA
jgi:hypothetical protein